MMVVGMSLMGLTYGRWEHAIGAIPDAGRYTGSSLTFNLREFWRFARAIHRDVAGEELWIAVRGFYLGRGILTLLVAGARETKDDLL